MRYLLLLAGLLPISAFSQSATNTCTNITPSTPELASICSPGDSDTCSVDTIYKITQSLGSKSNLLPPIKIKGSGAICILNNPQEADQKPVNIYAQSIWIDGGLFQVGTKDSPITSKNKVTITMGGSKGISPAPQPLCASDTSSNSGCSEIAKKSIVPNNYRDITVTGGGALLMYGAKGLTKLHSSNGYIHNVSFDNKTVDDIPINLTNNAGPSGDINQAPYFNNLSGSNSWTYLIQPAGPSYFNKDMGVQAPVDVTSVNFKEEVSKPTSKDAPYILVLSRNVTDDAHSAWESGDWVSVATTSFVSHETEIVQICQIYNTKNPDGELPTKAFDAYKDAMGETEHPDVSVVVLAGAPSYQSKCPEITNNTPLKHYHFGGLTPTPGFFANDQTYTNQAGQQYNVEKGQAYSMYDSYTRNFGIDERAEVALLSRNIKLTSMAGTTTSPAVNNIADQYFGGNIAVMNAQGESAPAANVALVGVEIEKFGQPLVGHYPVHFHRLNSESTMIDHNLLVQDSSVHHSFNKCYVTHDTMGAKFYNNSCVRTIGQGFYLEDGHNIADNQYIRNLVSGAMAAALDYDPTQKNIYDQSGNKIGLNTYWDGDYLAQQTDFTYNPAKVPDTSNSGANKGNYFDSTGPSGFWITTFGSYSDDMMPNIFVNNSVAGCQLRGVAYWLVRQDINAISDVPSRAEADLYPIFTGNRGHACYDGVMAGLNFAETSSNSPAAAPPKPVVINDDINTSSNAPLVIFDSLTLTQIQQKAFWYRGVFVALTNGRFSGLKQGMTLLGGGGPEGNLLGFWGLVHNSVFAGITNNTVSRYVDCEEYYKSVGTGGLTLSNSDALPIATLNEMAQCVPFIPSKGGTLQASVSPIEPNDMSVFGDLRPNFNFQGYTFYDGPARMENNRFVNFRADPTNTNLLESINHQTTRSLVTKVDAHRMLNYQLASQLSNGNKYNFAPGGQNYFGYNGDAAFSWLKGNAQSVPPTQYALGNVWENTNFKHQVFTEIVNLSSPLGDGDKQTVEIDRDTTLSGYYLCESNNEANCSNNGQLNHFPISLNNLDIFSTKYTVDEPESRGRNNVIDSALMSPNKYATINIGMANQAGLSGDLALQRQMKFNGEFPTTSLTGRGGLKYMYEAMVMNNMAYSYGKNSASDSLGNHSLLVSYSDAPVDSLFINRVGICIGPKADKSKIKIYKTPRQWNSGVSYLAKSPYFTNGDITDTSNTCPSIVSDSSAFATCQSTAEDLSAKGWGQVSAYPNGVTDLNSKFLKGIKSNYTNTTVSAGGIDEGYYYDKDSGMLYFNMIQYPQQSEYTSAITPPYGTCDESQYTSQKHTIVDYLAYSNSDNIASVLEKGCYVKNDQPQTSELLTCPKEGCAVYTVAYDPGTGACTQPDWAEVVDTSPATTPSMDSTSNKISYSSPYALYSVADNNPLSLKPYSLTVNGNNSQVIRGFNYVTGSGSAVDTSGILLPLSQPVYVAPQVHSVNMSVTPAVTILQYGVIPPPQGTKWTLVMGSGGSGSATISVTGSNELQSGQSPYAKSNSLTIDNQHPSISFYYKGQSATLKYGNDTCNISFTSTSVSTSGACPYVNATNTTISLPPPSVWNN